MHLPAPRVVMPHERSVAVCRRGQDAEGAGATDGEFTTAIPGDDFQQKIIQCRLQKSRTGVHEVSVPEGIGIAGAGTRVNDGSKGGLKAAKLLSLEVSREEDDPLPLESLSVVLSLRLARGIDKVPVEVSVPAAMKVFLEDEGFTLRFWYYVHLRRRIRSYDNQKGVLAHDYSVERIRLNRPSDRILRLIQPLAAIDRMTPESRVLAIGCRFEADMLYLAAYGFDPKNIRGLDMVSYSPWIDCGNMHQMSYADGSWDAILLGWTLAYSDQPTVAAREIVRVTRDGGLVAIGVTYYPPQVIKQMQEKGELIGSATVRIQTVQGILDLFQPYVDRVYFNHDVSDLTRQGPCMVIFSIKKG